MEFTQQYKVMHAQKTVLRTPGENVYSITQDGPACDVSEFRSVLRDTPSSSRQFLVEFLQLSLCCEGV